MKKLSILIAALLFLVPTHAQKIEFYKTIKEANVGVVGRHLGTNNNNEFFISGKNLIKRDAELNQISTVKLNPDNYANTVGVVSKILHEALVEDKLITHHFKESVGNVSNDYLTIFNLDGVQLAQVQIGVASRSYLSQDGKYIAYVPKKEEKVYVLELVGNTFKEVGTEKYLGSFVIMTNEGSVLQLKFDEGECIINYKDFIKGSTKEVKFGTKNGAGAYANIKHFYEGKKLVVPYLLMTTTGKKWKDEEESAGIGAYVVSYATGELEVLGHYEAQFSEDVINEYKTQRIPKKKDREEGIYNLHISQVLLMNDDLYLLSEITKSKEYRADNGSTTYTFWYDGMFLSKLGPKDTGTIYIDRHQVLPYRLRSPMMFPAKEGVVLMENHPDGNTFKIKNYRISKDFEIKEGEQIFLNRNRKKGELLEFNYVKKVDDYSYIVYSLSGKKSSFYKLIIE